MSSFGRRYYGCGSAVAGSTLIVGTPAVFTVNSGGLTVPVGVTPGMFGIVVSSSADGLSWGPTGFTVAGVRQTSDVIDDRAAGNMRTVIQQVTGCTAGQTLTPTGTNKANHWTHIWSNIYRLLPGTAAAGVRPGSQANCVSGSLTPAAGQRVVVVATERTTLDGTTLSGVTSSGGETVTQATFDEDAATTDTGQYIGSFLASAAAARTAEATFSSGSGNGYTAVVLAAELGGRRQYAARR